MTVTQWRHYHRILGIILILPMSFWVITGLVFHGEFGYEGAYESLPVKAYPLGDFVPDKPDVNSLETRYLRTCLGVHLLIRREQERLHLDGRTGAVWSPEDEEIFALLRDSVRGKSRYGDVLNYEQGLAYTSTGVRISVDWQRLTFYQSGIDTRNINRLWSIHRLRWFGISWLDKTVGWALILLSLIMLLTGTWLLWGTQKKTLTARSDKG